jgi:hypothetical protein
MAELDPMPVEPIEEEATVVVPREEAVVVTESVGNAVVTRRRTVYGGMWGTPEIIAVSVSAAMLLITILAYFFWVLPSNRELAKNKSEADRLEAEVLSSRSKYGEITSTEGQVNKLLASVDDFQMRYLPVASNGQGALYQRLNSLFLGYGLMNTSGPDYAPLEMVGMNEQQQSDEERGRAKYRSLFPGVYVTMTVEGSYQNLRRFIRELETGNEFVVVSAVELAPSETQKQAPAGPIPAGAKPLNPNQPVGPVRPKGKVHGETVSLHIELAAYFRRPDFSPMSTVPAQQ